MDAVVAIDQVFPEPPLEVGGFTEIDPADVGEEPIHAAGVRGVAGDVWKIKPIEAGILPRHPTSAQGNRRSWHARRAVLIIRRFEPARTLAGAVRDEVLQHRTGSPGQFQLRGSGARD
jgi:hypothetical protein